MTTHFESIHESQPGPAAPTDPAGPAGPTDRITTLEEQLAELRERYDQSQQTITALERRQRIDALLAESDPIDLDAARLLTEVAVSAMDEPDLAAAVDDLRRHKPYLFRQRHDEPSVAQSPRLAQEHGDPAQSAHEQAQQSGDRRDLLRYLRLRRERS